MRVLSRFLLSATNVEHFPVPNLPEVAFLGRSNVGKSSVINSLLGSKVARTSSTPGRTQSINFFEIRWPGKPQAELVITDLPGYGYARVPTEITDKWPAFIEPYLKERANLALCIVLVDCNVPPQASDKQLVDFLSSMGRPFRVVATKADRLSGNKLGSALQTLANQFGQSQILTFSARSGMGKNELWQEIRTAMENHRAVAL